MSFLLERDAVNGKEGRGFMTIDGENHEMFGLKKFQSDAEFQEADFKVVGTRLVQKKTTGVALTGSMTIYYGTPYFLKLLQEYLKTGKLPYSRSRSPMTIPPPAWGHRRWSFIMSNSRSFRWPSWMRKPIIWRWRYHFHTHMWRFWTGLKIRSS